MKTSIALAAILIAATPAMAQHVIPDPFSNERDFQRDLAIQKLQWDQQRARENYQNDQLNAWTRGEPSEYGRGTLFR